MNVHFSKLAPKLGQKPTKSEKFLALLSVSCHFPPHPPWDSFAIWHGAERVLESQRRRQQECTMGRRPGGMCKTDTRGQCAKILWYYAMGSFEFSPPHTSSWFVYLYSFKGFGRGGVWCVWKLGVFEISRQFEGYDTVLRIQQIWRATPTVSCLFLFNFRTVV